MYCPKCGKTVDGALKYCNGCGERLAKMDEDKDGMPGKMLDNILTTLFLIVMFGLGILVGLVAVLLDKEVRTEVVTLIVLAYLASVFGICAMLVKQVPKLIDAKLRVLEPAAPVASPAQLETRTTAQLLEHREPVMSVTDHTTKTLDKMPIKEI